MTDSDILLAINSTLIKYKTNVVKTGPKVDKIRIICQKRAEDQDNISKQLKIKGVNFKNEIDKSESSFPVTKIDLPKSKSIIKLIYKKSGGGSGAGAALTKLSESAQALYAAVVFNVLKRDMTILDVTKNNFLMAASTVAIDVPIDTIINDLPDDWINSSILGANALYRYFKNKGSFTFHRGSPQVSLIENNFNRINKLEKAFGNLNKWSPADIYMIKPNSNFQELNKENSLLGLNAKMYNYIINNQIIGISLKKIGGAAKISKKNFPSDSSEIKAKFYGITSNIDSIDGYIQWGPLNNQKIQFRSFGGETSLTGWQGEIKGSSANQGKISLGPINFILRRYSLPEIPSSLESSSLATKNTIEHCMNISQLMSLNGIIKPQQIADTASFIQSKSNKYRYSKYLVMKLFEIINKLPIEIKNNVVQDFYLYASSQANYSAPYYKLE